ncbi:MAG TPA: response regulator [Pirellulaceae bacterium]|nr:response regulator [Pirellulaceae bacterium]
MTAQRVLFIGDPSHHEFREPLAWLGEYCELTIVDNTEQAAVELASVNQQPDFIVVAAARPGRFMQHDVVSLLRRAPLARIIGLMGGWCEGEMRTGQPWRGVTRVYWHQFVPRLAEELIGTNERGRLAMPRTFTESELSNITVPVPEVRQRGLAVIRATSLECYEAIAEACHAIGHSTVWVNHRQPAFVAGAAVAIWDVALSIERDEAELAEFAKQVHPAPVIAMIGFPRASDRQRAVECGATCVVSKPYLLQELWTELTRVTANCTEVARQQTTAA